jgi:DNA modification methylase
MFPIGLAENLIKTFSRFKDIVLDPFAGSGNMILAALRSDRDGIGIDIEAAYVELA